MSTRSFFLHNSHYYLTTWCLLFLKHFNLSMQLGKNNQVTKIKCFCLLYIKYVQQCTIHLKGSCCLIALNNKQNITSDRKFFCWLQKTNLYVRWKYKSHKSNNGYLIMIRPADVTFERQKINIIFYRMFTFFMFFFCSNMKASGKF